MLDLSGVQAYTWRVICRQPLERYNITHKLQLKYEKKGVRTYAGKTYWCYAS